MRRANPRQIGSICHFCSVTSVRAVNEPLIKRSLRPSPTRITTPITVKSPGATWISTNGPQPVPDSISATITSKTPARVPRHKAPADLANSIGDSYSQFIAKVNDTPDRRLTRAALESCLRAASALQPLFKRAEAQVQGSASRLALLGAERTGAKFQVDTELINANNKISQTAYNVITHSNVEMTSDILELYVHVQAQLGRPESLPSVLELYAHKTKPVVKDGAVQYISQNPNAAVKAIEKPIADLALQTAIDAKNLDAALGITEASFCVKAFKRQKLLKKTTAPAIGLATLPFGIFGLATAYASYWQNTMDFTTATGVGVAGISGYFFVTGSLGMIAKLSAKEQMKRVTWLPGTPLRYRWMREEEREAMDKIACAWGFKESWRHGEETGPDWEGIREYMGYRQMILDRVEFMEGMN